MGDVYPFKPILQNSKKDPHHSQHILIYIKDQINTRIKQMLILNTKKPPKPKVSKIC